MRTATILFALLAILAVAGAQADQDPVYLAHNLWFEHPTKIYSTNYKKGSILPAGTTVEVVSRSRKKIVIQDTESGMHYTILYVRKHHPGLHHDAVYDRMLTKKTFEALTSGLTAEEVDAIRDGVVRVGMSKEAVLVSQGYPPETRTPDRNSRIWKYWASRFDTFDVYFDEEGIVTQIVD